MNFAEYNSGMIEPMRLHKILFACAGWMAFLPQSAVACSDLANICAAQAQHYQNMLDISATPPWSDEGDDSSSDEPDYLDTGPRYSQAEWSNWLADIRQRGENAMRAEQAKREQRMLSDPAYRQFIEGHWLPMNSSAIAAGGSCILHFSRKGQGVLLMGPSQGYDGAFLGFYGYNIPTTANVSTITVSLQQDSDPAQRLQVLNTATPWAKEMGMLFFAVPTIDAAIAGMTDQAEFEISRDGAPLLSIAWHGGRAAKAELEACVASQRAGNNSRSANGSPQPRRP